MASDVEDLRLSELVDALLSLGADHPMWQMLHAPELDAAVADLAPANATVRVDEDYLDEIAAAFGEVVDSKSPYTSGHSERVALYTDLVAPPANTVKPSFPSGAIWRK